MRDVPMPKPWRLPIDELPAPTADAGLVVDDPPIDVPDSEWRALPVAALFVMMLAAMTLVALRARGAPWRTPAPTGRILAALGAKR